MTTRFEAVREQYRGRASFNRMVPMYCLVSGENHLQRLYFSADRTFSPRTKSSLSAVKKPISECFFTPIVTKIVSIEYSRLPGCYGIVWTFWRGVVSSCAWLRSPRTDCLTLKMEALRSFETSVIGSTQRNIVNSAARTSKLAACIFVPKLHPVSRLIHETS